MKRQGTPRWWYRWQEVLGERPLICFCRVEIYKLSRFKAEEFSFNAGFGVFVTVDDQRLNSGGSDFEGFDLRLKWKNALDGLQVTRGVSKKGDSHLFFYQVDGKFEVEMQLDMFPFDTQCLQISMISQWDSSKVCLRTDRKYHSELVLPLTAGIRTHFEINPNLCLEDVDGRNAYSQGCHHYDVFNVKILARRFFYRHLLTNWLRQFIVSTLAFTSFAIKLQGFPSRDRLTVVISLMIVASFDLKKDEGPVTWLDSYYMSSFLTMAFLLGYHSLGVAFVISLRLDYVVLRVSIITWLIVNVYYIAKALRYLGSSSRRKKDWDLACLESRGTSRDSTDYGHDYALLV